MELAGAVVHHKYVTLKLRGEFALVALHALRSHRRLSVCDEEELSVAQHLGWGSMVQYEM